MGKAKLTLQLVFAGDESPARVQERTQEIVDRLLYVLPEEWGVDAAGEGLGAPYLAGFSVSQEYPREEREGAQEAPSSPERHRCLTAGCNPALWSLVDAEHHRAVTGHRIAKWPVRSAEGKRRARIRNKTGYYRKYNVGEKSPAARGIPGYGYDELDAEHPFSEEAVQG